MSSTATSVATEYMDKLIQDDRVDIQVLDSLVSYIAGMLTSRLDRATVAAGTDSVARADVESQCKSVIASFEQAAQFIRDDQTTSSAPQTWEDIPVAAPDPYGS